MWTILHFLLKTFMISIMFLKLILPGYQIGFSLGLISNAKKSAVLSFSYDASATLNLIHHMQFIPQASCLRCIGMKYDSTYSWYLHLEMLVNKGTRVMGLLRRCARICSGMRWNTLILIYRSYICPILEFGCSVFLA